MDWLYKGFKWLPGAVMALLMFGAGVGPKDAVSHLSEWFSLAGIENVPPWLSGKSADKWAFRIGLVGFLIWWFTLWVRSKKKKAPLDSDMTVNEAIHYIGLDSKWAWTRSNVGGMPSYVRRPDHLVLLDSFEEFRKAAERGIISVRGRPIHGSGVVPIEKDYWITAGVAIKSVLGKEITIGQTGTRYQGGLEYDTLIVPRDQIEKFWTRAGALYRKWTDVLFLIRKIYARC